MQAALKSFWSSAFPKLKEIQFVKAITSLGSYWRKCKNGGSWTLLLFASDYDYNLVNFKTRCPKDDQYKYSQTCIYLIQPQDKFSVIRLRGALPFVNFVVIEIHLYIFVTLVIFLVNPKLKLSMHCVWMI